MNTIEQQELETLVELKYDLSSTFINSDWVYELPSEVITSFYESLHTDAQVPKANQSTLDLRALYIRLIFEFANQEQRETMIKNLKAHLVEYEYNRTSGT